MNEKLFTFLLIAICLLPLTIADGCVFIPDYSEVYAPSQKAAIFWDGTTETMILSTKISVDNLTNLAWVVPIPSKVKPEVDEGDIQIFYELTDLFNPIDTSKGWGLGVMDGGMRNQGIQVIETKKVDIYDITILKATDASVLVDWLNENGYNTPETAIPILQDYCDRGDFYFIANKINLTNKYENLKITNMDRICAEAISIPDYLIEDEYLEEYIKYWLEYETECENASSSAIKILYELKQGISTPLKFTFQPEKPFYPMKISSINDGDTEVKVYVFSETPVEDERNVLSTAKMTPLTNSLKDKYNLTNEKYITQLTYDGDLKDLKEDSYFASTKYNSDLDPNYISLNEKIRNLVFPVLEFTLILSLLSGICFIIAGLPFIVGYFAKMGLTKLKNKYVYYTLLFLSLLGCIILSTQLPKQLIFIEGLSLLAGFYAAHKNSKKWVWISSLLILISLLIIIILFQPYF